jgi:hypothetical protein
MNPSLLSYHNGMGFVRYDGRLVATYTPRGWVQLPSNADGIDQLVNRAITGIDAKATAESIVHAITELDRADLEAFGRTQKADLERRDIVLEEALQFYLAKHPTMTDPKEIRRPIAEKLLSEVQHRILARR